MKVSASNFLQGWVLFAYARLIQRTARYQVVGQEHLAQVHASGRPLIMSAWHGMTMMLAGFVTSRESIGSYVMIVPDDARGATLSTWAQRLGAEPFVISMKADSMVAARRVLELIRHLQQGKNLVINPDGPYGPSREPKDGLAVIARKSGALIVPAGAYAGAAIRLPRWDRYTIPLPFSRIAVVMHEPFQVPGGNPEQVRATIRDRINAAESAAEALYRGT